jgi:hypothetical protein
MRAHRLGAVSASACPVFCGARCWRLCDFPIEICGATRYVSRKLVWQLVDWLYCQNLCMCRRLDIACDRPVLACGGVFQLNKYAVNIATCTAQTSDPSNLGHEIGKRLAMRLAGITD